MNEPARTLRPLDRVLIATLVPFFLVVFALQLREGLSTGMAGFILRISSASAGDFPVVEELDSVFPPRVEGRSLEVGDRLVRLGDQSLMGASMLDARTRLTLAARRPEGARLEVARGDERFSTSLFPTPPYSWWVFFPFAVVSVATSLILVLRAPEWPGARSYFVYSLVGGVFWVCGSGNENFVGFGARYLCLAAFPISNYAVVSMYWNFTPPARPLRRWQRAHIWIFPIVLFAALVAVNWVPRPTATIAYGVQQLVVLVSLASALGGVTRAYRRSDALERRQIRWVLYAVYLALLPFMVQSTAFLLGAETLAHIMGTTISPVATLGVPLGLLVAFFGYRFLDVDPLISATTSYTILGVILFGVAVEVLPQAAATASTAIGVAPAASQWALALGFALVIVQGHRWLRPWLDRQMFASRVAVEEGLARLVAELGHCRTAQELTRLAAERIDSLVRPESIAVYAREESVFTPIFARGRAVPPAFASDSPLVHTLESRTAPIIASTARLDPFDAAALATLGAEVVTPTRRGDALVSFTCLGRKRSGDIYTPAERALLAAVATASGAVLQGLGDAEVIEQGRAMQASLRRYVPGAIAEQLESGRDLEAGQREVTVLFVDLRGYATYAEKRPVEDVFSTVNEHTERVSRIVRARGGAVVEFNGDGMMAVFGAPEALAAKERQAIEAAREIVDGSPPDLAVGIGIATGLAYAGNIRAADRWIWSVIGDTTNLAARLQALTRELEASIAVDEATRRAAGYVCADFARHADVSIRGRSQRLDVFALPLASASAA